MNPSELNCWRCGANLGEVPLPYGRRSECPACHVELHACRMCRHHAPGKAKQCRESAAEDVKDKTRGNFCDWFQPAPAGAPQTAKTPDRTALEALFDGSPAANKDDARKELDDLFGG